MNSIKIANQSLHTKNHEVKRQDNVKISSAGGMAVIADSSPAPSVDLDNRDGWLFKKVSSDASKFNYYIYGNTGSSHQFTFADLKTVHVCCSIDKWDNTASVPIINVYSKPTGSGDAGAFYHSRKDYSINMSNQKIVVGEHINLYAGERPELHNDNRYVPLETLTSNGTCAGDEEILYIVIGSESGSLINTQILAVEAGYNLGHEIKRSIRFVT